MPRMVVFDGFGGPDVLRIDDVDVADPGPAEIRVRVHAIGLNRADALFRSGTYIETPTLFPSGLGLEAAGIVDMVGDDTGGFDPGDAVCVIPSKSMARWPVYGELVNVPAELVVKRPPGLDWREAASIWMAGITAYGALIDIATLTRGDQVVITAASSSVGIAAIQIANSIGATAIAITRTMAKHDALIAAGATHVVASDQEDLAARLATIAGDHGIRVVLDAVGGPAVATLAAAMAPHGVLIEYGGLSAHPTPFPLLDVLGKQLTIQGYLMHRVIGDPLRLAAAKKFILDGLARGSLAPVIARTFPFEEIVAAHRYLESNQQFGKIVVTL